SPLRGRISSKRPREGRSGHPNDPEPPMGGHAMRQRRTLSMTLIGGLAAAFIAGTAPAAEMTLKLGHLANEQNSWHKASLKFAEEVAELTDGRIAVEVYPNESLGKEMDLINGMQLGTADMTITGESLQNWAPMAALLAIPYAYKSLEQMDAVA